MDDNQSACLFIFILCVALLAGIAIISTSVNYFETEKMDHQYRMAVVAHPDALIWDDDARMWVRAEQTEE